MSTPEFIQGRIMPAVLLLALCVAAILWGCGPPATVAIAPSGIPPGQETFRFDTFGNDHYWTDTMHLERGIQQSLDPMTATAIGLSIDMDALSVEYLQGIRDSTIDLNSPATMVALLGMDAVVGLRGTLENGAQADSLTRVGITCALCHSSVDDAIAPGIGHRRDGWPNRRLNLGALLALSPRISSFQREVFSAQGPRRYDDRTFVTAMADTSPTAFAEAAPGSVRNRFRAEPLHGFWGRSPLTHEGNNPALAAIVNHYDALRQQKIGRAENRALVAYLRSL